MPCILQCTSRYLVEMLTAKGAIPAVWSALVERLPKRVIDQHAVCLNRESRRTGAQRSRSEMYLKKQNTEEKSPFAFSAGKGFEITAGVVILHRDEAWEVFGTP
jgi:hypothetical protein